MLYTQWFKVLKHVTYNECEWNQPTFPLRESCLECGWVHIYAFVVNTIKSTFLIISINWLLPFFYLSDQAMLSIKTFLKTKLKIWKKLIKDTYRYISLYISYTLLKEGRILIGLWFSLSVLLSFLKQVWHWHIFTQWEKWFLIMSYWSCDVWKKQQCSYFLWWL